MKNSAAPDSLRQLNSKELDRQRSARRRELDRGLCLSRHHAQRLRKLRAEGSEAATLVAVEAERAVELANSAASTSRRRMSPAHSSAVTHAETRLEAVHLELLGREEQLARAWQVLTDGARATANAGLDTYIERLRHSMNSVAEAVHREVLEGFGAATPLLDMGRRVKWWADDDERAPFAQSVYATYTSECALEELCAPILEDVADQIQRDWIKVIDRCRKGMLAETRELAGLNPEPTHQVLDFQAGLAANLAVFGLGGTMLATAVLAAGWHTLAWSLGSLFLPALPVLALLTTVAAVVRRSAEAKKAASLARQSVHQLRDIMLDRLDTAARLRLQQDLHETAKAAHAELAKVVGGVQRIDDLRWLLRRVRSLLSAVREERSRVSNAIGLAEGAEPSQLVNRAREALQAGDALGAQVYAAVAVEGLVRRIVLRRGVVHDFGRRGSLNRAIDRLGSDASFPPATVAALHRLREQRNLVLHGLDAAALQSNEQQRRAALSFLAEIEEVYASQL